MKKILIQIVAEILLGLALTTLVIGSLVLLIAMPEILGWLSQYIGEFFAWMAFILLISLIIVICINRA